MKRPYFVAAMKIRQSNQRRGTMAHWTSEQNHHLIPNRTDPKFDRYRVLRLLGTCNWYKKRKREENRKDGGVLDPHALGMQHWQIRKVMAVVWRVKGPSSSIVIQNMNNTNQSTNQPTG